jgi:hypothetical protein
MANISTRFYKNKATQRHQTVVAEFDSFYSSNLRETVEFLIKADGSYMRVSMSPIEAMNIAHRMMRFATILISRKADATNGN